MRNSGCTYVSKSKKNHDHKQFLGEVRARVTRVFAVQVRNGMRRDTIQSNTINVQTQRTGIGGTTRSGKQIS